MVLRKFATFLAFLLSLPIYGQAGNQTYGPINTQALNYQKFVGTGNYSTVQLALTDACAQNAGFGSVLIEQGASPADGPTIGGVATYTINGCTNVQIFDQRGTTGQTCYVYSNSTTYNRASCATSGSTTSPLSGMTAGQVPIAASATTVTSSKPLGGSGSVITTGPSVTVSPDMAYFCSTTGQLCDSAISINNLCQLNGTNCPGAALTIDSANYATINLAGAACSANPGVIVWHTQFTLTGSTYQLPATCLLQIVGQGASIALTGSQTLDCSLTHNGCIYGPPINIGGATGGGIIGISGPRPLEWFGGVGDGNLSARTGTDNTTPFSFCIAAGVSGPCTGLAGAIYRVTGSVSFNKISGGFVGGQQGFVVTGLAGKPTLIMLDSATGQVNLTSTSALMTFKDFAIQRTVLPTGTARGFSCDQSPGLTMDNVNSFDSIDTFYFHGCSSNGAGITRIQGAWGLGVVTGYTTQQMHCVNLDSEDGVAANTINMDTVSCAGFTSGSTTTWAVYHHGTAINDVYITNLGATGSYGIDIEYDGTGTLDSATDIHYQVGAGIETTNTCIKINNVVAISQSVRIDGGHCFALPGSTYMTDVESSKNVAIANMEMSTNTTLTAGNLINNTNGMLFSGNLVNGGGHSITGVYLKGTSATNSLVGNMFSSLNIATQYDSTACLNSEAGSAYTTVGTAYVGLYGCGNNQYSGLGGFQGAPVFAMGTLVNPTAGIGTIVDAPGTYTRVQGDNFSSSTPVVLALNPQGADVLVGTTTDCGSKLCVNGTANVSSLTSGNCVQASTGGLLTTTGSPCGSGSGTIGSGTTDGAAYYTGSTTIGSTTAPTTSGHVFTPCWQPSGSAVALSTCDFSNNSISPGFISLAVGSAGQFTVTSAGTTSTTAPLSAQTLATTLAAPTIGSGCTNNLIVQSVGVLYICNGSTWQAVGGGDILIASSTTPTFNTTYAINSLILTANVTGSTLAAGNPGQHIALRICQNATGSFTFTWPTNVFGGGTIGSTASKCNTQGFDYYTTAAGAGAGWYASGSLVMNQ